MIHNYLDNLTVEELLKYVATGSGFDVVIRNGHVQALVPKTQEQKQEDPKDGGEV